MSAIPKLDPPTSGIKSCERIARELGIRPLASDLLAFLDGQRAYIQFDGEPGGYINYHPIRGWEAYMHPPGGRTEILHDQSGPDTRPCTFREALECYIEAASK